MNVSKLRSIVATADPEVRYERLAQYLEGVDVPLPNKPLAELREEAHRHQCRHDKLGKKRKRPSREDPRHFSDRITVNYIRHSLTEYDKSWRAIMESIGRDGYVLIRNKVLIAIAEKWPEITEAAYARMR